MRILQINGDDAYSTGNIMLNIAKVARVRGYEVITASKKTRTALKRKRQDPNHIYIGTRIENTIHRYFSWITDLQDCGTIFGTLNFLRKVHKFKPDVVHLHDILGWYLNIDLLFLYLKWIDKPVVWTFHDCWAFTGRCVHFDYAGCDNWKRGCGNCPQIHYMPRSWFFDLSAWNFRRKRRLFTSINNLRIVTPSEWLANLTRESFLQSYPIQVINNGIDLDRFKPTKGELYKKYKSLNKKIVLGVTSTWSHRKGLDTLIQLAKDLDDKYIVLLVGITQNDIPSGVDNLIAHPRTDSIEQLAEIYTVAELLANPTLEDNFPTVNLESLACGTPILTYRTGGSVESVTELTGRVVDKGDYPAFRSAVIEMLSLGKDHYQEACLAQSKRYDRNGILSKYVDIYKELKQDE